MKDLFRRIANRVSAFTGSAYTFLFAVLVVVVWAVSGSHFNYSNTWQLVINTGTTIVTFLMVFLIQNTQNRDSKAMQLKLDELIRTSKARDSFLGLESLTDEDISVIDDEFKKLQEKTATNPALSKLHSRIKDEKNRRTTLRQHAGNVITTLFNPLNGKDKK